MDESISAKRVAALAGDFSRTPAYAGLADALTLLIGDGRIPLGVRLPSERELMQALDLSRTTVTRAYAILRETGYAAARQGSGTYAAVPGGRTLARDRTLTPWEDDHEVIDLTCGAASAPPEIAVAYAAALAELPRYLSGHGYFPAGVPELQRAIADTYTHRGLPTAPDQIVVTPGALSALAIVARALVRRRDQVLVESPVYPNAAQALRDTRARLLEAPVDPQGWDVAAIVATIKRAAPEAAYLIPDFQNPTGSLMGDEDRARLAKVMAKAGTVPVIDEAHHTLALDGQEPPRPFGAHLARTVSIGSASKAFWGGLRVGWIRAPRELVESIVRARTTLDLGVPVIEQLATAHLLAQGQVSRPHLERMREHRDALCAAIAERLPSWSFRKPGGGLALWCELPTAAATRLAIAAERRNVVVTPGPVFSVNGGFDRFVRIPWARPVPELRAAVGILAETWAALDSGAPAEASAPARVMVA